MLDLTSRSREKVSARSAAPAVEVVSVEATGVCQPAGSDGAALPALQRMLEKRLEIARVGIHEVRKLLRAGDEEHARFVLEKVDEDLDLLGRRVGREFSAAALLA